MKIDVFYIYPAVQKEVYEPLAQQFYESLWDNDDHIRHCNGWPIITYESIRTGPAQGKDIGAYIRAARFSDADIMVCIGSHVRINAKGWLDRVAEVWGRCGPGLYGPFGSEAPIHHLRTTAFWCEPYLLEMYPYQVETDQDRYNFELDKKRSITAFATFMNVPVRQVTISDIHRDEFIPDVGPVHSLMLDRFTDMAAAAQ